MLPRCGFTDWCYTLEKCRCNVRNGLFQLTINDWIQLRQNEMIELTSKTIERFEHIYRPLRHDMPFLFVYHVI